MRDNEKTVLIPYHKYLKMTESQGKVENDAKQDPSPLDPILDTIPSEEKSATRAFIRYLQEENSTWKWNNKRELQVKGKTVKGSNMANLLRYMRGKVSAIPLGWKRFRALFPSYTTLPQEDISPDEHSDLSDENLPPPPPSIFLKRQKESSVVLGKKKKQPVRKKDSPNVKKGGMKPGTKWIKLQ